MKGSMFKLKQIENVSNIIEQRNMTVGFTIRFQYKSEIIKENQQFYVYIFVAQLTPNLGYSSLPSRYRNTVTCNIVYLPRLYKWRPMARDTG